MDTELKKLLKENGQEHILRYYDRMAAEARQMLLDDLRKVDFSQISSLYRLYTSGSREDRQQKVFEAAEVIALPRKEPFLHERKRLSGIGQDCLHQGRIAVFLVAGGQGTRLGFDGPKGCFPVSPLKSKSLFRLFAESIRAQQHRYGKKLPWYIMTSYDNNAETVAYFEQEAYLGLAKEDVRFIIQKEVPSLDLQGRLIISPEQRIFKNPNGHGGSLHALHDSGALAEMAQRGIDEIFYFQVDNPLAKIADPLFIGAHVENRAQMSTKVVRKTDPAERVGIIGRVNGKLGCIEYSELSPQQAREQTPDGKLRFSSANTAIHMINRGFVEQLTTRDDFRLPYHLAVKAIESLDLKSSAARTIEGIKFEIFDALGFALRSVTLEVPREEEFSPVKNSSGQDSPATARAAMLRLHAAWLKAAGMATVLPDNLQVEISPLFALDEDEFREKFTPPATITSPLYIE